MIHSGKLRYTWVPDFRNERVVLIVGGEDAFQQFAALLNKLARGHVPLTVALDSETFVVANPTLPLTLNIAQRDLGMRRLGGDPLGSYLDWEISRETAARFAQLVDELARAGTPGHQYLDVVVGDALCVVVSKGEYDDGSFEPIDEDPERRST